MRVKQAEYIDEYKIKILFSDGVSKIVDLSQFLKTAKHVFIPLKDIEYFKNFIVDDITISWPNHADFDPEFLYDLGIKVEKENKKIPRRKRRNISSSAKISRGSIAAKS